MKGREEGENFPLRVLIAGGGTGGHIYPALAIADALGPSAEVLFLGTPRGFESRLVPQAGYRLELLQVGQLKGVSLATRARTLLDLPKALFRAGEIIRGWKPDVAVGVGGYASGPAMAAAIALKVPTLAFEPNAAPGLANRLVGRYVSAAAVNFAPAAKWFRRARVTGIPVRAGFSELPARPADAPPRLLVFGGSQGARVFNRLLPRIAPQLLAAVPELELLHQTGARAFEETRDAFAASGTDFSRCEVRAFLDDMPARFGAADLVLSRSGASTVAELCAAGKASILVPFPRAADDHQRRNAEVLAESGAAVVLLEKDLTAEKLTAVLTGLLADRAKLQAMGGRARTLAYPGAGEAIAGMVRALAGKQKSRAPA